MAGHLRTELGVDTLEIVVRRRSPGAGLIHHTDREAQYTSLSFGKRVEEAGILPSMGRTGSAPSDAAMAESFVSTLKADLVDCQRLPTRGARVAVLKYIEGFSIIV